jgi:hypothetical protein
MKINRIFLLFFFVLLAHSVLHAQVSAGKGLFSQGRSRATIYGTTASSFNQTYFVLGLGYGYYIFDGLQLGVDAETWLGADPSVSKVTPQILYVVRGFDKFFPYLGVFGRRTFIEDLKDLDSYGGRAGAYFMLSPRVYAGVGYVFEQYTSCDDRIYSSCSTSYPELNISVGF